MSDLVTRPTGTTTAPMVGRDRLDQLLSRIADGDRTAFRRLYAFMAMRVWHMATRCAARPRRRRRGHDVDLRGGVAPGRRRTLRRPRLDGGGQLRPCRRPAAHIKVNGRHGGHPARQHTIADGDDQRPTVDVYDSHLRRELTDLLGRGRANIRTSPGVFIRIDDLGDALVTIAAAAGSPRRPPIPGRAAAPRSAIHPTTVRRQ